MQTKIPKDDYDDNTVNDNTVNEKIIRAVASVEHDYILLVNLEKNEYKVYFEGKPSVAMPPVEGKNFTKMVADLCRCSVTTEDVQRNIHDLEKDVICRNLSKQTLFSAIYKLKSRDKELRYKKMQYFWLDEQKGLLILTRSDVTKDMMEENRQRELLKSALRHAEQANNAKTEFLSKISHEIRTPMNSIIGFNSLAEQNLDNKELVGEYVIKAGLAAKYLLALINDILDMSRIESGKLNLRQDDFTIESVIQDINTVIYEQAKTRNLSYEVINKTKVGNYYVGDIVKVKQILLNLLSNAVKFTAPGGYVRLLINKERCSGSMETLKFSVQDNGVGIEKKFQKKIFQPFEQGESGLKSTYKGTGLGLAICKNLVEIMGGSIVVNSVVNVGTEFLVNIPFSVSRKMDTQVSENIMILGGKRYPLKDRRILLVEDHPLNIEIATKLLEKEKIHVIVARNGVEAVETFLTTPVGYFDAILMDIRMPKMDGLTATKNIRRGKKADCKMIPIIAMSANAFDEDVEKSKAAGMNDHLSKPIDPAKLYATLQKCLQMRDNLVLV